MRNRGEGKGRARDVPRFSAFRIEVDSAVIFRRENSGRGAGSPGRDECHFENVVFNVPVDIQMETLVVVYLWA